MGTHGRIIVSLYLVALAGLLKAEVTENLEYTYYRAHADPTRSLLSILNASSPIHNNGKIFHGYTRWDVKWYFHWFESPNGRCKLTGVSTELTGSIKLPRLFGATSAQRDQFNRYESVLRVHELGHFQIGREAAATIDHKILSLPEMSNCKDLAATGNDIGYQTIREHKKKGIQYDASTDYGRSQGAWLKR